MIKHTKNKIYLFIRAPSFLRKTEIPAIQIVSRFIGEMPEDAFPKSPDNWPSPSLNLFVSLWEIISPDKSGLGINISISRRITSSATTRSTYSCEGVLYPERLPWAKSKGTPESINWKRLSARRENTPMLASGMNAAILILFYLSEKIPPNKLSGELHYDNLSALSERQHNTFSHKLYIRRFFIRSRTYFFTKFLCRFFSKTANK